MFAGSEIGNLGATILNLAHRRTIQAHGPVRKVGKDGDARRQRRENERDVGVHARYYSKAGTSALVAGQLRLGLVVAGRQVQPAGGGPAATAAHLDLRALRRGVHHDRVLGGRRGRHR